jgi:hypothetical protein
VTKGAKGGVGFSAEEVLEPAVSLGWNSGGGEMKTKKIAECGGQNKITDCSMEIYMPNGEIRTHFGCVT